MLAIRLRKAVVYATTGVFFLVAAMAQLQGASIADTFMKAGLACMVMTIIGVTGLRIVDDAIQKPTAAAKKAAGVRAATASTATPAAEAIQG